MLYAGVDTHKKYSRVVVTDSRGKIVAQASLSNDVAPIPLFTALYPVPSKGGSNCLHAASTAFSNNIFWGSHNVIVRIMAFMMVRSLRMQATNATFLTFPASNKRW
jgi:hypothetical protein